MQITYLKFYYFNSFENLQKAGIITKFIRKNLLRKYLQYRPGL